MTENTKSNTTNVNSSLIDEIKKLVNETVAYSVNCRYYNEDTFNAIQHKNPKLSVFHLNIRSLNANRLELQTYLDRLTIKFDIISLSEIGRTNIPANAISFRDYDLYYQESKTKCGGTAILIKNNLTVIKERKDLHIERMEYLGIENTWLECKSPTMAKNFIIGVIYKHPSDNISLFNREMEKLSHVISKEDKLCIICGDFNINLLNYTLEQPKAFLDVMVSENYIPYITLPTRITDQTATLIDNIFVHHTSDTIEEEITSGNLLTDITDHLPNFLIYGQHATKFKCERPYTRIYSKENIEKFKQYLKNERNWTKFMEEDDCNNATEEYLKINKEAHDKFFPLKQISIRRSRDKK